MGGYLIGSSKWVMARISLRDLTIDFPIYGANSRSFKKRLISGVTGGRIGGGANDAVCVRALENVSIEIEEGSRIGLIGHNGAGKTTFLRVLAGIYKPTQGSIAIEGSIGALLDPASGIDPDATGLENIYLRGYALGMARSQIESKLEDIVEFTQLGDFISFPVRTYSVGMRARLIFAISTSIEPEILLVDEGIGAGDAAFQSSVERRLNDLYGSARIVIIATHDQALIEKYCDKTLLFERASICAIEDVKPRSTHGTHQRRGARK